MDESRAMVTGAAGFIGSHLCERLLREGWRVLGVDSFTDYYDPTLKERNVTALLRHPRFRLERCDLLQADLSSLLDGIEVIWHLAAQAGVRASWGSSFREYTNRNVDATQRLLEAAVVRRPRRFIYASSSSVYGEAPVFPMPESGPLMPISPYGVTKLAGEHLVRLYALGHGINAVSLRFFTVYGPRQRPDMGFHRFFRALLSGEPLRIFGDGWQTRDFTFVYDILEAALKAETRGTAGDAYNVSGGSRVALREVIRVMEEVSGTEARCVFEPRQKGDPLHTGGDSSRARQDLGYEPAVGLEEGLREMADWMRRYLGGRPE